MNGLKLIRGLCKTNLTHISLNNTLPNTLGSDLGKRWKHERTPKGVHAGAVIVTAYLFMDLPWLFQTLLGP